jgi:hypothetical protein
VLAESDPLNCVMDKSNQWTCVMTAPAASAKTSLVEYEEEEDPDKKKKKGKKLKKKAKKHRRGKWTEAKKRAYMR